VEYLSLASLGLRGLRQIFKCYRGLNTGRCARNLLRLAMMLDIFYLPLFRIQLLSAEFILETIRNVEA
jgi:hypothetical protein